ncbi:MAG: DUF1376 domain-containing protein [Acidobacteriaceae bacterium]
MPLDVLRLRDSGLAARATGDEFRAAVLLWCASWHQIPAASLPDDDIELANLCGYGRSPKEWRKIRDAALRGWLACVDGRLYHPIVAEKAREAWRSKLEQRHRTECARIKKHCQRHDIPFNPPDFDEWMSLGCPQGQNLDVPKTKAECPQEVPRETPSKRQGEGQGQGEVKEKEKAAPPSALPDGIPHEAWAGFVAMRTKNRKPMTPRAVELLHAKLLRMQADGADIAAVLDQSTVNGWQDVFPLKQPANGSTHAVALQPQMLSRAGEQTRINAIAAKRMIFGDDA